METLELAGRTVLVRADLNVPMQNGKVMDNTRIVRLAPTLNYLEQVGARIVLLSHFGRPGGKMNPNLSLRPIASAISAVLQGKSVAFCEDCIGNVAQRNIEKLNNGEIILLENLRFHSGEESNDGNFAAALAALGDVYINDAFSCSHRLHASVDVLGKILPSAAGRAMQAELQALEMALGNPNRPLFAIIGGAKISTKIPLLKNLISKVDSLFIGGAMANTFLHSKGLSVGKSLYESAFTGIAADIMQSSRRNNCEIVLPVDVIIADELKPDITTNAVSTRAIPSDKMILDIGPQSTALIFDCLSKCQTLVWNGPVGAFEIPPFDVATKAVATEAARLTLSGNISSIAGGGDTVSAISTAGVKKDLTYLSTAGGAFLEWLEGKDLPGVIALDPIN